MGFLDRLLGRPDRSGHPAPPPPPAPAGRAGGPAATDDERALQRYRYLLRTAPPEQIEQAHAEAFAALTPDQRRRVLTDLGSQVPEAERARSDDPAALARMATRAELRQPGTLERSFSRGGPGTGAGAVGGLGLGGLVAGGLLASVAGAFVGTAVADAMFDASDGADDLGADADQALDGDAGAGDDAAGDVGAYDDPTASGYGDDDPTGSGWGAGGAGSGADLGGDFGGGDFGGGGDF